MKHYISVFFGSLLSIIILTAPAYAFNSYISGDVGWSASDNLNINDQNGNLLVKIPYKSGTNLLAAAGSKFDNFRIEGEIGYQRKPVDLPVITGSSKILSLLANGYYDFHTAGIQPYLTAGIGFGWESLSDIRVGGNTLIFSGGVAKLAHQLGFGVAIPIVTNIAIDARYRYFAMGEINEANLIKYTPSYSSFLLGVRVGI
ncbi:MAG: porin family protein [Chlorobiaceae bacterium]|nr:porin family protein [Chlorobiaceae bacterium]